MVLWTCEMDLLSILILEIIILSCLFPYFIIKIYKSKLEKEVLSESKEYKDLQNFIEIKKYEFESNEKILILFVTISIALFVGVTITNLELAFAQLILAIGMFAGLSYYINVRRINQRIIKELYKLKDKSI